MTGNSYRQTGIIEEIVDIPRIGEPTPGLFFFGLLGNLASIIQEAPYSSHKYKIKTESGKVIYAEVDSSFTVGECVDVIPSQDVNTSNFYAYGESRVISSEKCTTKT